jgi:hypothetical protein
MSDADKKHPRAILAAVFIGDSPSLLRVGSNVANLVDF